MVVPGDEQRRLLECMVEGDGRAVARLLEVTAPFQVGRGLDQSIDAEGRLTVPSEKELRPHVDASSIAALADDDAREEIGVRTIFDAEHRRPLNAELVGDHTGDENVVEEEHRLVTFDQLKDSLGESTDETRGIQRGRARDERGIRSIGIIGQAHRPLATGMRLDIAQVETVHRIRIQ